MAPRCKRVVLCRGLSEKNDSQEAYVQTLETAGYVCECLTTLRFEFVNTAELQACLLQPQSYHGTSPYLKRVLQSRTLNIHFIITLTIMLMLRL